jgi:hypothetical protein
MVDCRLAAVEGSTIDAMDIAKILQHIILWMAGMTRWNAVILLAPTNNAADIGQTLDTFDAANDIVIQEGTYTFSRQSVDAKKCILHGPHKMYFQSVGGILYLM